MFKKICLISFDHWSYDYHIVDELNNQGFDSYHIKISAFKHGNFVDKLTNAFSKLFLGKNLKKIRRQEAIINELDRLGFQDQIIVINPEIISLEFHKQIKKRTRIYKAYLYDSISRHPIQHLLEGVFDTIYSFDKNDIKNYNFKETNNYNYLKKQPINSNVKYDAIYIGSLDERVPRLIELAKDLKEKNLNYLFLVIGKKKKTNALQLEHKNLITFSETRLNQKELIAYYKQANIIVDFIRPEQTGLSFRFFEALALQKKMITDNKGVASYDFYNPNNIYILDKKPKVSLNFFHQDYTEISSEVYNKYTIKNWVETIISE